jgi:hypothetical protein
MREGRRCNGSSIEESPEMRIAAIHIRIITLANPRSRPAGTSGNSFSMSNWAFSGFDLLYATFITSPICEVGVRE